MQERARIIPIDEQDGPAEAVTDAEAHPDEPLVEGLRRLDAAAYEELMERYEGPLYRFFLYSHGDHDLAQDQCAETFANMIGAIGKMRGGAHCLRPFVFGVARNVLRRAWRRRRDLPLGDQAIEWIRDRAPSAARQAAARQGLELALRAIELIDQPARQILLLRFVEELSIQEISEALDLPEGTIKSHIHRSRKRLKTMLADRDDGRPSR